MKKTIYLKKIKKHEEKITKLWKKIVNDTNDFIRNNPDISMYSFQNTKVESLIDYMALSSAWIQDRINGKFPKNRGSLTSKIRKSLGYIY